MRARPAIVAINATPPRPRVARTEMAPLLEPEPPEPEEPELLVAVEVAAELVPVRAGPELDPAVPLARAFVSLVYHRTLNIHLLGKHAKIGNIKVRIVVICWRLD